MAWVMKDVINELFVDRRADMIRWIALGVIAIFLVRGLATYGNAVILSRIGNKSRHHEQARRKPPRLQRKQSGIQG
ncbi:MAG: hypothetical protein AAGJ28_18880, partial [Pseudomonadota bacterium]